MCTDRAGVPRPRRSRPLSGGSTSRPASCAATGRRVACGTRVRALHDVAGGTPDVSTAEEEPWVPARREGSGARLTGWALRAQAAALCSLHSRGGFAPQAIRLTVCQKPGTRRGQRAVLRFTLHPACASDVGPALPGDQRFLNTGRTEQDKQLSVPAVSHLLARSLSGVAWGLLSPCPATSAPPSWGPSCASCCLEGSPRSRLGWGAAPLAPPRPAGA